MMSADLDLGYVYLPIETPTHDFYGGHRLGNDLFGESIVCLDARTGKRVWHFQIVHHGLWDYDLPAAPILHDVTVYGRTIKAVTVLTKQSMSFVFDRVMGKPVWPIEERPVPQIAVSGERQSPTQPFPTKPAMYSGQGYHENDLIDFTPELKAEALATAKRYISGPMYTPPTPIAEGGTQGTWVYPGYGGGANRTPESQRLRDMSSRWTLGVGISTYNASAFRWRGGQFQDDESLIISPLRYARPFINFIKDYPSHHINR